MVIREIFDQTIGKIGILLFLFAMLNLFVGGALKMKGDMEAGGICHLVFWLSGIVAFILLATARMSVG